jgi:hypothetical protein
VRTFIEEFSATAPKATRTRADGSRSVAAAQADGDATASEKGVGLHAHADARKRLVATYTQCANDERTAGEQGGDGAVGSKLFQFARASAQPMKRNSVRSTPTPSAP